MPDFRRESDYGEMWRRREERMKTVDADPTWRERNNLAPGIMVYMDLETVLDEIRRALAIYPVVAAHRTHPLGISLFQDGQDIPGRIVFCYTEALRDRVLSAAVSHKITRASKRYI